MKGLRSDPRRSRGDEPTMPHFEFIWTDANVTHLAEHGLTPADVEYAVANRFRAVKFRKSGLPAVYGPAIDGTLIFVVYRRIDETRIFVVTAFEPSND
jgi:hypothetical protein